jgi:hypothetical protein
MNDYVNFKVKNGEWIDIAYSSKDNLLSLTKNIPLPDNIIVSTLTDDLLPRLDTINSGVYLCLRIIGSAVTRSSVTVQALTKIPSLIRFAISGILQL